MTTEALDIDTLVNAIAGDAREAALVLANAPTEQKNRAILRLAELIEENLDSLRLENAKDLAAAKARVRRLYGADRNRRRRRDRR